MINSAYQIQLDFGSGFTNYETVIDSSFTKSEILHKNLKTADSILSFTLVPNVTLYNLLRATTTDIKVRATKDTFRYFTGYLRKNFKIEKTQSLRPLKVEAISQGFYLKRKIPISLSYYAKTVTEIITDLLTKSGITTYTIPSITTIIPGITFEAKSTTYHQIIEQILFEYGYVFRFDDDGRFITDELFPTNTTTALEFNGTNIINKVQQDKVEESIERVDIDWIGTSNVSNAVLFSDTSNAQNGYSCYIELAPFSYLMDKEELLVELSHVNGEVLYANNLRLDINADSGIEVKIFEQNGTTVRLSIKNNNTVLSKFIRKLDIRGDAIIKKDTNTSIVVNVVDTELIQEYESKYLFNKSDADYLVQGLANYYKYSDFKYNLSSYTNYDLGSIVTVTDDGIGTSTCRIIEKKINETTDLIDYRLEALNEYTGATVIDKYSPYFPAPTTPNTVNDSIAELTSAVKVSSSGIMGKSYGDVPTILDTRTLLGENGLAVQELTTSSVMGTIHDWSGTPDELRAGDTGIFTRETNQIVYYNDAYYILYSEKYLRDGVGPGILNRFVVCKYKFSDDAKYILDSTFIVKDFATYQEYNTNADFIQLGTTNKAIVLLTMYNSNTKSQAFLFDLDTGTILDDVNYNTEEMQFLLTYMSYARATLSDTKVMIAFSNSIDTTYIKTLVVSGNTISVSDSLVIDRGYIHQAITLSSSKAVFILAPTTLGTTWNYVLGLDGNNTPIILNTITSIIEQGQDFIGYFKLGNYILGMSRYQSTTTPNYCVLLWDDALNSISILKSTTAFPNNNCPIGYIPARGSAIYDFDGTNFYFAMDEIGISGNSTLYFAEYSIDVNGTITYVGNPNNLTLVDKAPYMTECSVANPSQLLVYYKDNSNVNHLYRMGYLANWVDKSAITSSGIVTDTLTANNVKINGSLTFGTSAYPARGINISTSVASGGVDGDIWIQV